MRWMLIFLVLESFLWGGSLNSARADIIGFRFSGSWTKVDSAFTGLAAVGQPVIGTIYYDTTISAAAGSDDDRAYYYGSDTQIINLSFTTDKIPVKIKKAGIAIFDKSVANNNSITPKSEFELWFNTNGGPGKETQPTSLPKNTWGAFLLYDEEEKLFNDDELASTISPLQAMTAMSFTLSRPQPGQMSQTAVATIDSITPLPVPEPETIILLCLGLTLISFNRRFNNRKGGFQKLRA